MLFQQGRIKTAAPRILDRHAFWLTLLLCLCFAVPAPTQQGAVSGARGRFSAALQSAGRVHGCAGGPLVGELLAQSPPLVNGGGMIFPQKNGWLALGIGYAALCRQRDDLYLLVVESGPLTGSAAYDRAQLPIIIETKARTQAVRFLAGISLEASSRESEELLMDGLTVEEKHSLASRTIENTRGVATGMRRAGEWQSDDGKRLFQAFVLPLAR